MKLFPRTSAMSLACLILLPLACFGTDHHPAPAPAPAPRPEVPPRHHSTCEYSGYPHCAYGTHCAGPKSNCCYDAGTCKDLSPYNCHATKRPNRFFPPAFGPHMFHFKKHHHRGDGWFCSTTSSSLKKPNPSPLCSSSCDGINGTSSSSSSRKFCWGTLTCDRANHNCSHHVYSNGGYAKEGTLCIYEEDGEHFSFCGKREKAVEEEEWEEKKGHKVHKKHDHEEEEEEEEKHRHYHEHHEIEEEDCEEEEEKKVQVHHHQRQHRPRKNQKKGLETFFENAFEAGFKTMDKFLKNNKREQEKRWKGRKHHHGKKEEEEDEEECEEEEKKGKGKGEHHEWEEKGQEGRKNKVGRKGKVYDDEEEWEKEEHHGHKHEERDWEWDEEGDEHGMKKGKHGGRDWDWEEEEEEEKDWRMKSGKKEGKWGGGGL